MNGPAHALSDTIAVVVINWNGWRYTLACLASLRASLDTRWRLYLVDNASSDDSLEHLNDLGDDVVLLRSPVNGGWTGGNNVGVRRALDDGHDLIFILNNDAEVLPDTIGALRRIWRENCVTLPVLGPVQIKSHSEDLDFVGADVDPRTGMPRLLPTTDVTVKDLPMLRETSYIRGAGLFTHRRHFERIGFFDDAYYLNYDETDWCFHARSLGVTSLMTRDALIRHVGSATLGIASPLKLYFLVRNGLLFAERHCSPRQRLRLARAYVTWAHDQLPRTPAVLWVFTFLIGRSPHLRAFKAGVWHYVRRRFGDCPDWIRRL